MKPRPDRQSTMRIEEEYIATHPKSQELFHRALKLIAGGVSHDGRYMSPFPFYVVAAKGSKLWDVDGNEYVDYQHGHESLILGHGHPSVIAAIKEQLSKGVNYGACHELEIRLAELINQMVPCAERVRFTGSGGEANMLAVRLARAYTGKNKIIKFRGHWHGGFPEGFIAVASPFDVPYSKGITEATRGDVLLANQNSSDDVRRLIETNEVACVLMEPSGAHTAIMPSQLGFVEKVRQVTEEKGVILIFDEVLSGFRFAPGGLQEVLSVTPDLATLGKGLGGGFPVSAVVGKKEILGQLDFTEDPRHDRYERVRCQGSHSGMPLALAAAVATLEILKTGEVHAYLNRLGAQLKKGMNEQVKKHNIPGCIWGRYGMVRYFLNHDCPQLGKCDFINCTYPDHEKIDAGMEPSLRHNLFLALLLNGISPVRLGWFFVSRAHSEQDIEKTVDAFDYCLARVKREGILKLGVSSPKFFTA